MWLRSRGVTLQEEQAVAPPALKSLILTTQRARIVALLLMEAEDGTPRRISAPEICAETDLGTSTARSNMRTLVESGWFELGWEEGIDPYDFTHQMLHRQIFVREGLRDALSLRLKNFQKIAHREPGRRIEYAAPQMRDGAPHSDHLDGGHMPPGRKDLLVCCLRVAPGRYFHPSEMLGKIRGCRETLRNRMERCEEAGLMVSKEVHIRTGRARRARVFKLTDAGVIAAEEMSQ